MQHTMIDTAGSSIDFLKKAVGMRPVITIISTSEVVQKAPCIESFELNIVVWDVAS